jgi:glucitol/sorbitol PTS system EIIA component
LKYNVIIKDIGKFAFELLENGNCLIIFDECAPEELAEISLIHTHAEIEKDIVPGDTLFLGSNQYKVTAVGTEAMKTLRELGHCTLNFNGTSVAELPGQIELRGEKPVGISIGDAIKFEA